MEDLGIRIVAYVKKAIGNVNKFTKSLLGVDSSVKKLNSGMVKYHDRLSKTAQLQRAIVKVQKNRIISTNKLNASERYAKILLNASTKGYAKFSKNVQGAKIAQQAAAETATKGTKAINASLREQIRVRAKQITLMQKSGVAFSSATKKQHEGILRLNDALTKNFGIMNKARKIGAGLLAGIKKAGMTFLTILGPLFLVGAALRTVQQAADWAFQPFIKFEDALYELRKTAGLALVEMWDMGAALSQMALRTPIAAEELAKVAATAGRLGIRGSKNIISFTETVAMMATATVLTSEEAAESLAKLAAAFDLPIRNIRYLASAINELSNTTASTSRDIVSAMERIGASGKLIGITAEQSAAMTATLVDMGMGADRAGPFSEDTEILTSSGWKLIKELKIGDLLYTLNPNTDEIEIHPNENLIVSEWSGKDMIHIRSKSIDLKVTPEHKLWGQRIDHNEYESIPAKNILPRKITRFKRSATWNGNDTSDITIPSQIYKNGRSDNEVTIPMDLFVKYIGLFLSEGSISKNYQAVEIDQNCDSSSYGKIKELHNKLQKFGFNYSIYERNGEKRRYFIIHSKQLALFLSNLGFNRKSHKKYIPTMFKDLTSDLLKDLIYYFRLGDGDSIDIKDRSDSFRLYSSSEQLIDDFQEISLKAGYVGIKHQHKTWHFQDILKNKYMSFVRPSFTLSIQMNPNKLNPQINTNGLTQVHIEKYKGKNVYCPVVKNHIVYVRRNGRPVWCQQTRIRRMLTELARKSKKISKSMEGYFANWGEILREDPMEALLIYMRYLEQIKDPIEATTEAYETFGKVGGFAMISLSANLQDLEINLKTVENEMIYGTSLAEEYAIAIDKTSSALQLAANRSEMARRALGERLAPTLVDVKNAWSSLLFTIAGTTVGLEAARDGTAGLQSVVADTHAQFLLFEEDLNVINARTYQAIILNERMVTGLDMLSQKYLWMRPVVGKLNTQMNVLSGSTTILDASNLALASSNERIFASSGSVIKSMEKRDTVTREISNAQTKYTDNLNAYTKADKMYTQVLEDESSTDSEIVVAEKNKDYWYGQTAVSRETLTDAVYNGVKLDIAERRVMGKDKILFERHAKDYETIAKDRAKASLETEVSSAVAKKHGKIWDQVLTLIDVDTAKNIKTAKELREELGELGYAIIDIEGLPTIISTEQVYTANDMTDAIDDLEYSTTQLVWAEEALDKALNSVWGTTRSYISDLKEQGNLVAEVEAIEARMPAYLKDLLAPYESDISAAKELAEANNEVGASLLLMSIAKDISTKRGEDATDREMEGYGFLLDYIDKIARSWGELPMSIEGTEKSLKDLEVAHIEGLGKDVTWEIKFALDEDEYQDIRNRLQDEKILIPLIPVIQGGEVSGGMFGPYFPTTPTGQTGIDYVPHTGVYKLHEGETVLTKQESKSKTIEDKSVNVEIGEVSLSEGYGINKFLDDIEIYSLTR